MRAERERLTEGESPKDWRDLLKKGCWLASWWTFEPLQALVDLYQKSTRAAARNHLVSVFANVLP